MAERHDLTFIRGSVDAAGALQIVASATDVRDVRVEREICYPYHWFSADCSVPTIVGRKVVELNCLVDAVNGLGATADPFSVESKRVPGECALAEKIDAESAVEIARGTVTHRLGRRLRMIATFDVKIEPHGLVHKCYWVVRAGDILIMVDSTTGNVHELHGKAA